MGSTFSIINDDIATDFRRISACVDPTATVRNTLGLTSDECESRYEEILQKHPKMSRLSFTILLLYHVQGMTTDMIAHHLKVPEMHVYQVVDAYFEDFFEVVQDYNDECMSSGSDSSGSDSDYNPEDDSTD